MLATGALIGRRELRRCNAEWVQCVRRVGCGWVHWREARGAERRGGAGAGITEDDVIAVGAL